MAISWNNISLLCLAFLLFSYKLQSPRGLLGHPLGGQLKVVMAHFLNSPHTCVGQLRHPCLQCCGSGMKFSAPDPTLMGVSAPDPAEIFFYNQ
jgi:hypothetical protein